MKKLISCVCLLVLAGSMVMAAPLTASAGYYKYNFEFLNANSTQFYGTVARSTAEAYVEPTFCRYKTYYIVSPTTNGSIMATKPVTPDVGKRDYFEWIAGYDVEKRLYYLVGYPEAAAFVEDYIAEGIWVE